MSVEDKKLDIYTYMSEIWCQIDNMYSVINFIIGYVTLCFCQFCPNFKSDNEKYINRLCEIYLFYIN